jgi:hypothetical protein
MKTTDKDIADFIEFHGLQEFILTMRGAERDYGTSGMTFRELFDLAMEERVRQGLAKVK